MVQRENYYLPQTPTCDVQPGCLLRVDPLSSHLDCTTKNLPKELLSACEAPQNFPIPGAPQLYFDSFPSSSQKQNLSVISKKFFSRPYQEERKQTTIHINENHHLISTWVRIRLPQVFITTGFLITYGEGHVSEPPIANRTTAELHLSRKDSCLTPRSSGHKIRSSPDFILQFQSASSFPTELMAHNTCYLLIKMC